MKKLLIGLLVAGVLSTAIFASPIDDEYLGIEGNELADFDPQLNCWPHCMALEDFGEDYYFLLNGKVPPVEYQVQLKYGQDLFASPDGNRIQCFDLTDPTVVNTENFYVNLIDGNYCCENRVAEVTVTCDPFTTEFCCDFTLPTIINDLEPGEMGLYSAIDHVFTSPLPCGVQTDPLCVAGFNISWIHDPDLGAGRYHAMGKIAVTIM
jgi:hypothetical protein